VTFCSTSSFSFETDFTFFDRGSDSVTCTFGLIVCYICGYVLAA
jgi:hypothetical protein